MISFVKFPASCGGEHTQKEGLCRTEDITPSLAGMFLKCIMQDFHFNKQQLRVIALSLHKH